MKTYLEIIRRIIREKDIIPKLISILLAVGFWAYISSIETGTLRFKVPLTYKNLDQNLSVSKVSYKTILVEVRGSREELKNASIKNIKLFVDLSNAEPGVYKSYKVEEQKGEIPEGFDVELDPPEVKILVEKKIFKNVRIVPRYSGNVQKGFVMGRPRVSPEYVRIGGPPDEVGNITAVYTENISVDDRNATVKEVVKLDRIGEDEIDYGISRVSVTVPVLAYSDIYVVEVPVFVKNRKKGYRYILKDENVKLSLVSVEGRTLDEKVFTAFIDGIDMDINDNEMHAKGRMEKNAVVHVHGAGSEDENCIIQVSPENIDVRIVKE